MPPKPRFTLKAILGCTAALSVPLGMIAAGHPLTGAVVLMLVTVGCIAFLTEGWKGIGQALVMAGITLLVIGAWMAVLWAAAQFWFD